MLSPEWVVRLKAMAYLMVEDHGLELFLFLGIGVVAVFTQYIQEALTQHMILVAAFAHHDTGPARFRVFDGKPLFVTARKCGAYTIKPVPVSRIIGHLELFDESIRGPGANKFLPVDGDDGVIKA
jgi:hypothetical protein